MCVYMYVPPPASRVVRPLCRTSLLPRGIITISIITITNY